MGEIHVKDSGNSLREVKKVFVKDSTGTLRGPIRKAFVRDGSSVRDVFTKIETLSISGTPNSFTAATVEQAKITVSSIDNYVHSQTFTRAIGTANFGGTKTLPAVSATAYGFGAAEDYEVRNWPGASSGFTTLAIGDTITFSGASLALSTQNAGGFNNALQAVYLATGAYAGNRGSVVSGGYLHYNYTNSYGGNVGSNPFSGTSANVSFTVANSAQASATHIVSWVVGGGAQFSQENTQVSMSHGSFTATIVQNRSYNTVTETSANNNTNAGCTFSISGPFSVGTTTFPNTDNIYTAATFINTTIQSALPAGASSSVSSNVVTINFAAGATTDLVFTASNNGPTGSVTPANTNGATSTYINAGTVSASSTVTAQGADQSGNLSVVPITIGSTTTNITIPNNTDTDGAGTAIASALDGLSGVTSSYDSGTNKVTVIASGDVSVGTISDANSLSVSVD